LTQIPDGLQSYNGMDFLDTSYILQKQNVGKYFPKYTVSIFLPTASPEFMVMEGAWNMAKRPAITKILSIICRFIYKVSC
jgi:hypothetical protein